MEASGALQLGTRGPWSKRCSAFFMVGRLPLARVGDASLLIAGLPARSPLLRPRPIPPTPPTTATLRQVSVFAGLAAGRWVTVARQVVAENRRNSPMLHLLRIAGGWQGSCWLLIAPASRALEPPRENDAAQFQR